MCRQWLTDENTVSVAHRSSPTDLLPPAMSHRYEYIKMELGNEYISLIVVNKLRRMGMESQLDLLNMVVGRPTAMSVPQLWAPIAVGCYSANDLL